MVYLVVLLLMYRKCNEPLIEPNYAIYQLFDYSATHGVMDNLNTHKVASLYKRFRPQKPGEL